MGSRNGDRDDSSDPFGVVRMVGVLMSTTPRHFLRLARKSLDTLIDNAEDRINEGILTARDEDRLQTKVDGWSDVSADIDQLIETMRDIASGN